jgi:hypothetical protein
VTERNPTNPELLAMIWRSVACADELSVLLEQLGAALPREMRALGGTIYKLEIERGVLRSVASAGGPKKAGDQRSLQRDVVDIQQFLEWCRRGEVLALKPGLALPGLTAQKDGELRLHGPLTAGERVLGLVEWDLGPRRELKKSERGWAQALLDRARQPRADPRTLRVQ